MAQPLSSTIKGYCRICNHSVIYVETTHAFKSGYPGQILERGTTLGKGFRREPTGLYRKVIDTKTKGHLVHRCDRHQCANGHPNTPKNRGKRGQCLPCLEARLAREAERKRVERANENYDQGWRDVGEF